MQRLIILSLYVVVLFGCTSSKVTKLSGANVTKESTRLVVVADPQIHNMYGLGLKQMLKPADMISKVAIRSPELNILSPLILQKRIEESHSGESTAPLIVLGDGTNIACTGEYEDFWRALKSAHNGLILMAHGNHDSYLMGTVNSYLPTDKDISGLDNMEMWTSPVPTDESWWGNAESPKNSDGIFLRNWKDGCYRPPEIGGGLPINKSQWLRRYINELNKFGGTLIPPKFDENIFEYELSIRPVAGSKLSQINYQGEGVWWRPNIMNKYEGALYATYNSYVTQAFDISDTHRVILIDTSVCYNARGGIYYIFTNAGTNSCIGNQQMKSIEALIESAPDNKSLIFAGHFPLNALKVAERTELIKLFSARDKWTYISAHTHSPLRDFDWGSGNEINIGSTTDWPLEINSLYFENNSSSIIAISNINSTSDGILKYTPASQVGYSEVCRHMAAAKMLAEWNTSDTLNEWKSPKIDRDCYNDQDSWITNGERLSDYLKTIKNRFEPGSDYEKIMMRIAESASYYEYMSRDFSSVIP